MCFCWKRQRDINANLIEDVDVFVDCRQPGRPVLTFAAEQSETGEVTCGRGEGKELRREETERSTDPHGPLPTLHPAHTSSFSLAPIPLVRPSDLNK